MPRSTFVDALEPLGFQFSRHGIVPGYGRNWTSLNGATDVQLIGPAADVTEASIGLAASGNQALDTETSQYVVDFLHAAFGQRASTVVSWVSNSVSAKSTNAEKVFGHIRVRVDVQESINLAVITLDAA